jgi:hypothetical protein
MGMPGYCLFWLSLLQRLSDNIPQVEDQFPNQEVSRRRLEFQAFAPIRFLSFPSVSLCGHCGKGFDAWAEM